MSAESTKAPSAVEDYVELFEALGRLGVEFVVIGGCAVGVYARMIGETVFSRDLDVLVTSRALEIIVAESVAIGAHVQKAAVPRSVPVAVLDWKGHEINVLTSSSGLAPADVEARTAREFELPRGTTVLVVDPFDLLRNKIAVNRPKDQPHIAILRSFLDEEIVQAFRSEREPRARIGPADRLLEVLGHDVLDEGLATRLILLADTPADFRFLAHRAPTKELLRQLSERATSEELRSTVDRIAWSRRLT